MQTYFGNGIDGVTGDPVTPPVGVSAVAAYALADYLDCARQLDLRARKEAGRPHLGVRDCVDVGDLKQAGWGVLFAHDSDPAIREALSLLIQHRREQAGEQFRELTYRAGESKGEFLARYKASSGAVDPQVLPYYILIVGDPAEVPFAFQFDLDVQHAVGRVSFPCAEEYARYSQSVVQFETSQTSTPPGLLVFGVRNGDDDATIVSAEKLAAPLAEALRKRCQGWTVETVLGQNATKGAFLDRLRHPRAASLIFTAGHGLRLPFGDKRQIAEQGALLCAEWPGQREWGRRPVPNAHYAAASDLSADCRLWGSICFHFACYSGGTPRWDDFRARCYNESAEAAPRDFVSRLAQTMLAHPAGGALAVIAHVDRCWDSSFQEANVAATKTFEDTLARLMQGKRAGLAMELINQRYSELGAGLNEKRLSARDAPEKARELLASDWIATTDLRNYLILGDPAVRLETSAVNVRPRLGEKV
jgi:hypothetical protein